MGAIQACGPNGGPESGKTREANQGVATLGARGICRVWYRGDH